MKMAPKLAKAHHVLGITLTALGKDTRAAEHLKIAQKLEPNLDFKSITKD